MASIEIRGVDELIRKLGKVEGVNVLQAPMKRAVYRIQRDMADYDNVPAMQPGEWAAWVNAHSPAKAAQIRGAYFSKVKQLGRHPGRTGTLGRRWTGRITRSAGGLTGKVGNNTKYAPWVQSERFQAGLHRKRWQTDQQVVNRNRSAIVADFEREIRRALNTR